MDKSDLRKDFLDFVAYVEQTASIHDEHCHAVDHKKASTYSTKNTSKVSDAGG
jgi:hypothetical protein